MTIPDVQIRQPWHVRCAECKHEWVGLYLPLPLTDVVRLTRSMLCPMCAADYTSIQMVFKGERDDASK
jgi:hypothetical protein